MNRRHFIRNTSLAAAAAVVAPYILPSGRLFAQTGSQKAKYTVLMMFGGGVRHQESAGQLYLQHAQFPYTKDPDLKDLVGNIMPNLLVGEAPTDKIAYGSGANGENPIAPILSTPLQKQGVFFKEMYVGTAGHYHGFNALVSGNYNAKQGLRSKPLSPTIFEYVRRFMNPQAEGTASKVWLVGNTIGNSIPYLNYSAAANYGAKFGANFFAPPVTFGSNGRRFLAAAKNYHPEEDFPMMYDMKDFLDNSFKTTGGVLESLGNTPDEKYKIKEFMKKMFGTDEETLMQYIPEDPKAGTDPEIIPVINKDVSTLVVACEIMNYFEPTVIAVHLDGADTCHADFTSYLRNLHRQDLAVGYMWNFIQNHPVLKDNTLMVVAPETGRNATPNPIRDKNNWYAYDHSDWNAYRSWALMVGPGVPQNVVIEGGTTITNPDGSVTPTPAGDTAQIVLTVAETLGIKNEVASEGMVVNSQSFYDLL